MEQTAPQNINEDKINYSFFAFNILKAKAKTLFKDNSALVCLSKSDYFFQELSNTLNTLYQLGITPQKFEETIKNIQTFDTDNTRLLLISELYKTYINIMQQNSYKLPFGVNSINTLFNVQNENIKKRVDFLFNSFNSTETQSFKTEPSHNIEYIEFFDIQSEILYIIDEIKSLVESGEASYSQIAVFIDKTEARKKFLDLIKAQKLPVISSIYNEDYENLKNKINLYQKICDVFLALKLDEFSYDSIKNINISSKAQKEISFEELDDLFKTIVFGVVENPYSADKIFTQKENNQKSLIETIFTLWSTFEENDKTSLSNEFNSIKNFYEDYKTGNYAKAIETLIKKNLSKFENTNVKDSLIGKIKSLNDLQKLFENLDASPEFDSFKEIMQGLPKDEELAKNAVFLASVTTDTKKLKDIKYVYIAGLTQNNYPGANTSYPYISVQTDTALLKELQKINPDIKYFLKTDEIHFLQQLSAFCNVMSLAKNKLTLTTHTYEAKKQTQPSVFFNLFKNSDKTNFKAVETKPQEQAAKTSQLQTPVLNERQTVINHDDTLRLNPSAINTYLKCPRKYYYKNLLNLKEPYTFSASYGSIVHAVFQVLNTNFKDKYNKDTALALADILFNSAQDEEKAKQAGFSDTDIELVKATSELSLAEMKNNFKEAVTDYDHAGGFDTAPVNAVCEKSFFFTLPELPKNVTFDGRIDAIITDNNGNASVIDYKTGKDKTNTLDYAISEYGVNFKSKTGKDPSNIESLQKAYDYQIPLYYLAVQNSKDLAEFKDKITRLGLVYIRPKSKDNGCNEDFVSVQRLEQYKDKIIQNLKGTVIDKILAETDFKPEKGWDCDNCAYKYLCDGEDE